MHQRLSLRKSYVSIFNFIYFYSTIFLISVRGFEDFKKTRKESFCLKTIKLSSAKVEISVDDKSAV